MAVIAGIMDSAGGLNSGQIETMREFRAVRAQKFPDGHYTMKQKCLQGHLCETFNTADAQSAGRQRHSRIFYHKTFPLSTVFHRRYKISRNLRRKGLTFGKNRGMIIQ